MANQPAIVTPLTKLLGIKHPIILAGMSGVSHAELVAAVSKAGGLGVVGGLMMQPHVLRELIQEVKAEGVTKFGVDLALPQVGGTARKTNHDYTHGKLKELVDVIIEEGASLFVSAVGAPPKWVVDRLHEAGIPVMNMCGAPRHIDKALEVGCDIMCAQGTEGGGHTGDITTAVLLPQVLDKVRGHKSRLTGEPIQVVAAGGIYDGRGLAMALAFGCAAVWVGTRFICSEEAAASENHQQAVQTCGPHDTTKTLIYSGRPLRCRNTKYVKSWNEGRADEITKLTSQGIVPFVNELKTSREEGKDFDVSEAFPLLMGQIAGAVKDIKPAREIVEEMVTDAIRIIASMQTMVRSQL